MRVLVAIACVLAAGCQNDVAGGGADGGSGSGGGSPFTVAVTLAGQGSVRSTPAGIDCGTTCSATFAQGTTVALSATPASGWRFVGWSSGCSGIAGCNLTAGANVTATFEQLPPPPPGSHSLTLTSSGTGAGKVSSAPGGIDCGATCTATFTSGTQVTLTAAADGNSQFAGWSGECSGTGSCTVTLDHDASVGARFDTNAPPPPPPDDCAGLVGAAPGAASHAFAQSSYGACAAGYIDGDSTLAFPYSGYYAGAYVDFVSKDGALLTTASPSPSTIPTEQQDGFIMWDNDQVSHSWLSRYDSHGAPQGTTPAGWWSIVANDPLGGVTMAEPVLDHPGGNVTTLKVRNYDGHLTLRWETTLPPSGVAAVGVDRQGNSLIVTNTTPVNAVWIDHSGHAGTFFKLFDQNGAIRVAERVGSGLFIASGNLWKVQLDSQSTTPTPAPDWLASRTNTDLHMVHAGTGYAVLHDANTSDCTNTIDVVSPSGKVCGSQVFHAPAGGACASGRIRVGWDGTVVQQLFNSAECVNGQCQCRWQWWTNFY